MQQVIPILQVVSDYRHEITALLGNVAAATNGFNRAAEAGNNTVRYLRTTAPLGPEALAAYPEPPQGRTAPTPTSRRSGYLNLTSSLESFETRQCSSAGLTALLDANSPSDPDFNARFNGDVARAQEFFDRLRQVRLRRRAQFRQPADAAVHAAGPVHVDRRLVARAVAVPARQPPAVAAAARRRSPRRDL